MPESLMHAGSTWKPKPGDPPLLELIKVSKHYPGVVALNHVDFQLRAGEVHVLFGENGAGKSTLISILAGATQRSGGEVLMRGYSAEYGSVHQARALGITTVFQEFSLVPSMSIEENLFLGSEMTRGGLLDKRALRQACLDILRRLAFDLDPRRIVSTLTRAEQQMVEIARAFRSDLSVLILDEPTASLTNKETDRLFELVAQVTSGGVGVVYITHRMNEIERIADRVTILRDGNLIATVAAADVSTDDLVRLMTGRVIGQLFPEIRSTPGAAALEIRNLTTVSGSVRDASIMVRAGEVLGLAGLIGSGKSEVIRAAFGLERIATGGTFLKGKDVTGKSQRELLSAGFMYLPGDRKAEGLVMMRSCRENVALAALDQHVWMGSFLNRAKEATTTSDMLQRMNLQPLQQERAVESFSGGNQQKVLLGRSLSRPILVYAFDEPTVGVDVGTRASIYAFLGRLCEEGAAVILISSDLPEIINLAHRAYIFGGGRVRAELAKEQLSEANILPNFFVQDAT